MVCTFGSDIISAYTGGIPVVSIYAYGNLVWPTSTPPPTPPYPPDPTYYFVRWTPTHISSGTFSLFGRTFNYSSFNGSVNWSGSNLGYLGSYAFVGENGGSALSTISTNVKEIMQDCFISCTRITYADLSYCRYIYSNAFYGCTSLSSVYMPFCRYIGFGAFMGDERLKSIDGPWVSYISDLGFKLCSRLSSISLPICSYIGDQAFYECDLRTINLPSCKVLGYRAFALNTSLSQVSLPLCEHIYREAFFANIFSTLNLPSCEVIETSACNMCSSLTTLTLPVCSSIGSHAFSYCKSLYSVTLGSDSVCYIGSYAFQSTRITSGYGAIYVPSSLVDSYKNRYYSLSSMFYPIPVNP